MTKIQMPEPLRLRWNKYTGRYDISEDHRAAGDADLITTTQAEAYAEARVREALEEAFIEVMRCKTSGIIRNDTVDKCADAIRALIPTTK